MDGRQHGFAAILGQDKARGMLLAAAEGGKLGHAYLFRGPAGVGKKTMALAFARYLNCVGKTGGDACGRCRSCRIFASGNHPDFIVLEPLPDKKFISIHQVRDLIKQLGFAPFEGGARVVMLPDVHEFLTRPEAANSLLKVLEEPPADNYFILTADEGGHVLDTIASRCQMIPFLPLSPETVAAVLRARGVPASQARDLSRVAGGSVTRALDDDLPAVVDLGREVAVMAAAAAGDGDGWIGPGLLLADKMAGLKERLALLLDVLHAWFHEMLVSAAAAPGGAVAAAWDPGVDCPWNARQLEERVALFDLARRQLRQHCNRTAVCEVLLFGLAGKLAPPAAGPSPPIH